MFRYKKKSERYAYFSTARVRGKCISIMIIKFKGIIELINKIGTLR